MPGHKNGFSKGIPLSFNALKAAGAMVQ